MKDKGMNIFLSCRVFIMKNCFLVLLVGLTTISRGQVIEDIQKRLNFLNNPSSLKYDTTGFSKLPKFEFFCDDDNPNKWDYFSVIDLDNDGLNDLVYSGPCSPYDKTGIFINDGKRMSKIYDFPGAIISLEKTGSGTIINSLKESIGCDPNFDFTEIVIKRGTSPATNRIIYAMMPKSNFKNLEQIKIKGVLRRTPKQEDADKKDQCSNRILKGNHWLSIEKESNVIKLDQSDNWQLVLYKKSKDESVIGWIRSE